MKKHLAIIFLAHLVTSPLAIAANDGESDYKKTFKLYVMAGQSNMAGFGNVSDLPSTLRGEQPRVYIFQGNSASNDEHGGDGIWARLRPGHGAGFRATFQKNKYSNSFGPELTFGKRMSVFQPDQFIAIVKYIRGGSSLQPGAAPGGYWTSGTERTTQFDHFVTTWRNALKQSDIDGDGRKDRIIPAGILWMQGEGDASHTRHTAITYKDKLAALMARFREEIGIRYLPVVVGRIADSGKTAATRKMKFGDIVREAQAAFVESDVNATLVKSTDSYDFRKDGWHFTGSGYIDLGRQFADAIHGMKILRTDVRY